MAADTIAVIAPSVYVSITIEEADDGDDIHVHAGGQGVWVARLLRHLGHAPVVCAPIGGESGRTLVGLVAEWGVDPQAVAIRDETPAYVHDRRGGERVELARSRHPVLRRHEADELYDRFLAVAFESGRCVVTGPEQDGVLPLAHYRRLGADLQEGGVQVVADLHGAALDAFLDGGGIEVLKVSSGDLVHDGRIEPDEQGDEGRIDRVAAELVGQGARSVVVSRGDQAMLAITPDGGFRVMGPRLDPADTLGSGDSMTAALASARMSGCDAATMLARAWAAGAANVTRRGLGSAYSGLIDQLAARAVVERR